MEAAWFAGRLKELREASGITQPQLAERAGLTKDGVAQLETGRRSPSWETVVELCKALGVGPGEFLKPPADRPPAGRGRPRKPTEPAAPAKAGPAEGGKGKPRGGKAKGG
jgi:transcriptional regulator with XRE-family HTH domain